ncbi:MAG: DUF4114 domain-containing protein, partial [Phormidium sp.]
MAHFKFFSKKQNSHQNRKSKKTSSSPQLESFILEQILTPSGILDGTDENYHDLLVTDFQVSDLPEVDVDDPNHLTTHLTAEVDSHSDSTIDSNHVATSHNDLTNVEFINSDDTQDIANHSIDASISENDLEPISFIDTTTSSDDISHNETNLVTTDSASPLEISHLDSNTSNQTDEITAINKNTDATPEITSDTEKELATNTINDSVDPINNATNQTDNSSETLIITEDKEAITSTDPTDVIAQNIDSEHYLSIDNDGDHDFSSGVFTVGETGKVSVDYLLDGGGYKGEIAIFSIQGMEEFEPGSSDFIQEAAHRALSNSELGYVVISDPTEGAKFNSSDNQGNYLGAKEFNMRPGDEFGVMLVPNGTLQEVFNNPNVTGNLRPLFSLVTANPNQGFHVGQIADVTGDGHTFALEDLRVDAHTDRDYNDIIFHVKGATGKAVNLDEVIAPEKDWRTSNIGQELIAFAKSDINSELSDNGNVNVEVPEIINHSDNTVNTPDTDINHLDTDSSSSQDIVGDHQSVTPVISDDNLSDVVSSSNEDIILEDQSAIEISKEIPNSDIPTPVTSQEISVTETTSTSNTLSQNPAVSDIIDQTTTDINQPRNSEENIVPIQDNQQNYTSVNSPENTQTTANLNNQSGDVTNVANPEQNQPNDTASIPTSTADNSTVTATANSKVTETIIPTDSLEKTSDTAITSTVDNGEINTVNEHSVTTTDIKANNSENNNSVIEVLPPIESSNKPVVPGAFTVDSTGKVSIDYLFDGGYYQGDLAIFSLKGMEHLEAGSEAFIQEAAHRALSSSELGHIVISDALEGAKFSGKLGEQSWNAGAYQGAKTVSMTPGDEFAIMLVPNGKVQEVFDNPKIGDAKSPLFSISIENSSFPQMVDVTGKGHTFAFEDLRIDKADRDYNDIIFQVKGATSKTTLMDEAVAPGKDWRSSELGKELLTYAATADVKLELAHPINDITLTATQPINTVDLSQVFSHPNPDKLHYELVTGDSESLQVQLDGNQLHLTGLPKTGVTDVAIRVIDDAGNSIIHSFTVSTSTLSQESTQAVNVALGQLTDALAQNPENLIEGLDSEAGEIALYQLESIIQENPDVLRLLNKPETLSQLGISNAGVNTLQQFLSSKEIAEEFGLTVTLGEALSNPDRTFLDSYLINADEAVDLLPSDATQPRVGFLDFRGEHTQRVTESFASVNPLAKFDTLPISNGNWAEQLVKFVDQVRLSGENHGIVNLSFDLSQIDDIGLTTRYELTPAEQDAIAYAQQHNILLVVAAGNTGDKMSALGAAAEQFDNIITVGAVNQLEERADYSAIGNGLSIVAPGGEWDDDPNAFVGTSRATPYVTAAASLIWAANSGLSYQQVKQLLLDTAADLNTPGWDAQTGAGLLDVKEAVSRAQLIEGNGGQDAHPTREFSTIPFSGEGRVKTLERAASDGTEKAIESLENTQETLLEQWQVLADLGNPALTLSELQTQVGDKVAEAFKKYQEVSTQAGITIAQAEQWAEALALATQHYQIEETRLQVLEAQKKALEEQLAQFGEQKTALEQETQTLLANIKEQITLAESDLAKAKEKLTNPFADADDNLQINPEAVRQAALQQQQMAEQFQQQALGFAVEQERYTDLANAINAQRWQVVGSQSGRSGRTTEVWGLGIDPNQQKRKDTYNWQAGISAQNSQSMTQLSQQAQQQNNLLNQYADFLEGRQNNLDLGAGSLEDAA